MLRKCHVFTISLSFFVKLIPIIWSVIIYVWNDIIIQVLKKVIVLHTITAMNLLFEHLPPHHPSACQSATCLGAWLGS